MNEILRRALFLPPQSGSMSSDIDALHYVVITTTMLGAIAVAGVALVFLVRYRASRVPDGPTPRFHAPVKLEVLLIGGTLALFIGFWQAGFAQFVKLQAGPPPDAMNVYVSAKQWMWRFQYPNGFGSISVLYVPAGRPVRLVMTSRDVIHSFYVPDFRIKMDVVPGHTTVAWFEALEPGSHDIFCTEYCGDGHSTMRGRVIALSPEDWAAFRAGTDVGARELPQGPLASVGARVAADKGCLGCHPVTATFPPYPHLGPTWVGLYRSLRKLTDGTTVVADETYLTESMMDPYRRLVVGYAPIMPSYQGRLDPADTAAIVEYIRALAGPEASHGR